MHELTYSCFLGAFPAEVLQEAQFALEHRAAFRHAEQSNKEAFRQHKHGVTEHDAELFCKSSLFAVIAQLVVLCFPDLSEKRSLFPNRIYTNAMRFGDGACGRYLVRGSRVAWSQCPTSIEMPQGKEKTNA